MLETVNPPEEAERLAELLGLKLLDTLPEERFDRLTRLAKSIFGVKTALVSLVDRERQWFKSRQGLDAAETPRNVSFCGHAILQEQAFIVEDASIDPRFSDNPLVTGPPHVRFYAGMPLRGPNGYRVGTLCVIDPLPREFSAENVAMLTDLGALVETELTSVTLQEALRQVREGEERLGAILNNVADGILTNDEHGVIESVNAAGIRMFGYSAAELIGRNISMLTPEPYRAEFHAFYKNYGVSDQADIVGRAIKVVCQRKDSSVFPGELSVGELNFGGKRWLVGIIRDISERKRQEELRARYFAIIESSDDAIVSKTLDGIILSWNPGAERLFGYTKEEAIGGPMTRLIPPDRSHEEAEILTKIKRGERLYHFETVRLRKDGTLVDISATISPIKDSKGRVIGISKIARDVTELRHARLRLEELNEELKLRSAQAESANAAKSEFLANMSHEIRTPMNAVLGVAHLLGNSELSAEQRKYVDMIRVSGQSLMTILNDILDFSKIEAGRLELSPTLFQLGDVLDAVATIMTVNSGEKELELAIGIEPDVPRRLIGDSLRLQQVLVNLAGNAIKFTERGEVSVLVELLRRTGDNVELRFRVRDNGIGMDPEQQTRLFSAFTQADASTTRRFGGTGLGLTICKRLVELMGGSIEVRSALGQGSEFCVTLPLKTGANTADSERPALSVAALRLLVVNDNQTGRDYLCKTIRALGLQVDGVGSGTQAIERIRALQDAGGSYDAALVDWQMPGMDGVATMQVLRTLCDGAVIPVIIMLSAFERGKLMQLGVEAQADAILTKPVTISSLYAALHEALSLSNGEAVSAPFDRRTQSSRQRIDGLHILLAEDNLLNQVVARGMLEQAGATVDVADNGQLAVDLLRANAQRYDLVLMDVQMPVMDGHAATRLIRGELGLSLPVLAMTAGVMTAERAKCVASGMNDFIAKPIDVSQMFATISRYLPGSLLPAKQDLAASAPKALQNDAQIFDPSELLELGKSDPEYLRTLYGLITDAVEHAPEQIKAARLAWEEGEIDEAARMLHTMRGPIGTLGAARFAAAAALLEEAIHANQAERVAVLFDTAQQALAEAVSAAQSWLKQQVRP